ncbi:MAG: PaREP1 family protein [Pyrobaculum sp.]
MEGYLDFKTRPREYAKARLMEALTEAKLAEEMLNRELYQNAANKAFMALKALLSALAVLEVIEKTDEKRREWYVKVGYAAPTTGMLKIAKDLEAFGYAGVELATRTALMLHRFAYNGLDPDFVDYSDLEEVETDVRRLIEYVRRVAAQIGV